MELTSSEIFNFDLLQSSILGKLQANIWNIIGIVFFIIILVILKYVLQSEMKGSCPYCGREFILNKLHQDKLCIVCKKEFRLRNMRIYKGEDVVDELLYYLTKAFACLATMSDNIIDEQKKYVENFVINQNITRRQFNDMSKIYDKTLKRSKNKVFLYKGVIDRLKLYVEDYYSDRQMFELENNENNLLNILYDFAMIDGEIKDNERKFFKYFKKIFDITEDRFNLVVSHTYEKRTRIDEGSKEEVNKEEVNKEEYRETSNSEYKQYDTQENKNTAYNTKSQEYYKILECDSNVSDEELKKQYKKLMMQYHPDKYASNDLPEEIEKMLNNKMSELNEAYEYIKKERGIN